MKNNGSETSWNVGVCVSVCVSFIREWRNYCWSIETMQKQYPGVQVWESKQLASNKEAKVVPSAEGQVSIIAEN